MLTTSVLVLSAALSAPAGMTFVTTDAAIVMAAKTEEGVIKSVDSAAKSLVLTVNGTDVTVRCDDKTKYRLDGKDSTMAEAVKAGYKAKVSHDAGLATLIEADSGKKP